MFLRLRTAGLLALVTLTITCTDAPTSPRSEPAKIRLSPRFTPDAAKIYNSLALFGQEVTEVRIVLTAADGTTRDTVVVFPEGVDELSIDIPVPPGSTGKQFSALIELRNEQHTVLFSGTQSVTARIENTVFVPEVAEIRYTGPGRGAKTVTVLPLDVSVPASGTVSYQASAVDSAGNPVTDLLVRWTSSDLTLATAAVATNSTGSVVGQGRRGTVTISAITPAGITGTTRLTLLPVAARLVVVSGGGQTAVAGSAAAQPLVVEVQATDNLPVVGVPVTFRAVTTGGVTPATVTTDATGRASTTMRLGNVAGVYQFEATSGTLTPVTVSVTATPASAAALTLVSGDQQADSIGRPLPLPLVVKVTDTFGGPVNAATVTFTKESGAGTVSAPSVVTGSDGLASTGYTLGPVVGTDVVRAVVTGVSGAAGSVSFSVHAISRGVSSITIVSGGGQSGLPGKTLPAPLVARAADALNNPLANVPVTWTASANGASFSPVTTPTGANGEASTTVTLGNTSGPVQVTASSGDRSGSASLTVLPPPTITKNGGDGQSAAVGTAVAVAPRVLIKDGAGNPVAGASVVFAVESGAGVVTGANATTNASGIATAGAWILGEIPGANTLTATYGTLVTTFTATGTVGGATKFTFVQALPASIVVGSGPVTVSAQLLDPYNNPVAQAGTVVTGTAVATPGPGGGVYTATTNPAGVATFVLPSYVGAVGSLTFTLSSPTVPSLSSAPTPVLVGAPARLAIATQPPGSAQSGVALSPQPVIQVVDAGNNPVSQAGLSVTATIASGGGTLGGSANVSTSANGQAAFASLSIAGSAGPRTLAFSSGSLTPITSGTITLGAGPAASIAPVSGNGQQATVGSAVSVAPSVKVSDASDNGVAGTVVTFTAVTSGSRVSNGGPLGSSVTVTTNGSGVASLTQWVLGNVAQAYTLTATAAVPNGSPVTFTADAVAATGSVLAVATPPSATATNGIALAAQPVIQLKDTFGNPVSTAGVVITATIASGSGALSNTTATTGAGGVATFSGLAITGTAGSFVLQFSAPTYGPVTSAPIAVSAGALASITVTPNPATLTPGTTQQFSAVGQDAQGNVVTITPTWSVVASGGAISADGLFTAGSTAGSYANTVQATSGVISGTASVTVNPGALATITVTPNPGTLTPGGTQQFSAVGKDAQNNVISITPVWSVVAGGGTITGSGLFTAGGTAGSYANTVQATSGSVSGAAAVTVNAGALATITLSPNPATLTPGVTQQFTAVGKDAQNNVVSITPTWSVVAGGGTISATGLFTTGNTAGSYANTVQATSGAISGTASVTVNPGALATITVTPNPATLTPGATQQFTAVGKDAQNNVVSITPTWSVAAGGGAISATGLFTAGNSAGDFANTIKATSGAISGTASVAVTPGALASITVTPNPTTLTPGATQQFTAVGKDAQNNVVSITPTWSVAAGGGAISATGLFTAGNTAGDFANTIKATSGAVSGTASMTVTPGALATITVTPNPAMLTPGATQQFTAVGKDAQNNVVSITPTWSVAAGGGAISATGLFTAGNTAGDFANTIKATSGAVSGTASMTVTPGALATITVTPNPAMLTPGGTQQFTAIGKDAQSNVISITPVWSVAGGGGTITGSGLFTAGSTAGSYANTVLATSGSVSGTASVTVNAGALATITLSPNPATLTPGATQQFTAIGKDAQNNVVSITPTWSVVAGGGTISAAGLFTAGNSAGDFANTIKATSGAISGTASVTVNPGALATITVTPNPTTLTPGGTQQFTAIGKDAQSNVISITPVWSVAGGGGTITGSGLFTAGSTAGSYANTVLATSGSVSGTASVTVNAGALATITLSPNPATLTPGATQQFTAIGKDAQNNVVSITPTWSVVAGGGTISAAGLFTAGNSAGDFANTIKATSGAISGTASVTVNPGALATITVTPNPTTLTPGGTQQFTAIGKDAQNNVVSITPAWSVVASGGSISAAGLFTAGNSAGDFANTIKATSGPISGIASVTVTPGALVTITVTPNPVALTPGATQQFTAVGKDAQNNVVSITPTWSVVAGGGTIGVAGLFTAGNSAGDFANTIKATSGAISGTASVTVTPGALSSITIAPNPATLTPGATQQFTAVGKDAQNNVVSITPTWSVAAGGGAISATGLFTAGNTAGDFANTIKATSGAVSGTASMTVTPGALATITVTPNPTTLTPGATQQFTAVGKDAQNNVVSITPTWSVAAGGGAISATGLFTAGNTAGDFANTIKATSGAVSGTASMTVTPGALATITVTPNPTTLTPGATQQFTAVGKDAQNNIVSVTPTWSVVASGGAINGSGVFTAGSVAGNYSNTVQATSGAIAGTASVTVNPGALASITVTPNPSTLTPGITQQFTAVGQDAQGNVVPITPTWSVVAGGGAVSATGLFTAGNTAGDFANTIKATSGAISGTASVTVNPGALASIAVTPNPATLTPGATQQFTAVGKDAQNNIVSITPTWSVVAGGGTMTGSGLFTAGSTAGSYANTAQATSGAITSTASVTINPGALTSITVTPNPATLTPGATQQFTAVGTDAQNNIVSITPTWSVVAGGGTISAAGLFTAGNAAGSYANTVQATSGAISGTASVTVNPGALASITIAPNPATLTPGATQQFTAVGRDAQNNVVTITPAWSVVASGGSISAAGLFTAGNTAGDFANTIRATSGAISGVASVTVNPGALASITVTPNPTTLTPGATQQFTAVGADAQNNVVSITPTWSVIANGGTISSTGVFTAGSTAGSYANTVQATSGAISGTASVAVNPGTLATITVSPDPTSVSTGGTRTFSAVGKDANSNVVAITPTWSVVAGGGSIDVAGVFTAGKVAGHYANTVLATSGSISGTASVNVNAGNLATITITPSPATLLPGATQQFTAVGRDADDNVVTINPTWSVDASAGTISSTGLFTAGTTAGTYTNTVQATRGTVVGTATLTVTPGALATITVAPSPATLTPGATQQFSAVGKDANNNVVVFTPTWSVVAGGGAISTGGLFTAGNTAGDFANTVKATSGAIAGTASVTVNPGALASVTIAPNPATLTPGATQQFTAIGKDAQGNVVGITPTWSIIASGGTIDASGLFTAGGTAGDYANTVQATSGAISGTASVTVNPGALASITVTPNPTTLAPGGAQQFTAVGRDAQNNVVTITPTWSVVASGGTIAGSGLFTAGNTAGDFANTVKATSGAISGTASVTVNPGALASITITPNPATLTPGATQQFIAVGKDVQNNVITITPTWSVVAGGGAISASGLFTAGTTAGSYANTVQAASGSITGTVSVAINPGALASITVTPNPATLIPGAAQQFSAVGKDALNNVVSISPTWSVVAGGGTINANGLFTAGNTAGDYANTVQATSGAISGTAAVTVNPGALASITITPNPTTLTPGATEQFTAVGKDAQNNVVAIAPTWSVVASGGTITGSGLFTASNAAGDFANTVKATSGAISGTASVTVNPGALASITVTPNPTTLTPGGTQQFTAVGKDAQNNVVTIAPTWSVAAGGGAISASGLFTAGSTAGDFANTITATSGAVSGTASVTVNPGALASIIVTPNPATLTPGATQQFTAVGRDAQNNVVSITPTWSVVARGGTISGGGLFTAGNAAGSFANTVQATSGAVSGTASVTVNPGALATITVSPNPTTLTPGGTQQFTAVGRDAQNNVVSITSTWSVVAGGGSINTEGLFTAGNTAGDFANSIKATSGAISGTASVTVTPGALASITITPHPATLTPGATQQFTAVGKDAQNNIVTITPTWVVVAGGGAIDGSGLFTAGTTAGNFANTVQASIGAVSGTATVTVNPGALATITISPNSTTLTPGGTQQFTAVGNDAQGNVVSITPTWSVVASGGTISNGGLFTAGNTAGSYANTVQATSGAISGTASVTVNPGALASITITPNPATLTPGATQQFTAVGNDAQGNIVSITPTWAVIANGGTISSSGLFTAGNTAGSYANTVQATSGTISGTASVAINPGALASITVSPDPTSVPAGGTRAFTAVGKDANNNTVALTPTWSVVAGGGSIDAAGLFSAGKAAGHFANTVRATSGTISGTASVTVNAGNLATITITPSPATLLPGATQQFTAVGRDIDDNVVTINTTWSVEGGGGTISSTGVFTAGTAAGTHTNTVHGTRGDVVGTATVTITPGALASITVTPNPATLTPGATQQFSAVGRDANNNVVTITPIWSVIASGGTISSAGLFTAGNTAGSYANTVQATSGAVSGTASVTVIPGALASITISPNPATLTPGGTQQFTAIGRDAQNNVVSITPTWSVVASGGTIDAAGLFTAGNSAGSYSNTVQATSGTISGMASVTINPGALASITISPNPATLTPGTSQQFTAVGRDAQNNIVSFTPTWFVIAGGGSIDGDGLFIAGRVAGIFANTVQATDGSVSATASVTVNPGALTSVTVAPNPATLTPGATQQFTAVGKDANGNTITITPTWSVVAGGGAISASGLFTAGHTAGSYTNTVQAASGSITGTASVAVNPGTLASITVSPNSIALTPGASQQFTAVGKDAQGNVVNITPSWFVVESSGTIDQNGLFTAGRTAGSVANAVHATTGDISGFASVTVNPGALASITITPNPTTLTPGASRQFTAVGNDAQGNVVAIAPTWSVVASGGTIDAAGLFTAGNAAGSYANTVRAASGAVSATASVTINPGALASITITPNPTTLTPGVTQQFTAVGKDAQGNVVEISPSWFVVESGGTINAAGLFTAGNTAGSYTNAVQATTGGISGFASVTVNPGALASITVSPNPAALTPGATQQFTAVGRDAQNNVVAITPTWSVVASGGSIDGSGLFTAGNTAGSFANSVRATSGAISGTASVVINPGALATITVSPTPAILTPGATQPFTAVGTDAQGNVVEISPSWFVVESGGTINAAGLFTAGNTAGSYANAVQATTGGISGFASVTVNPGALASITVTPNPATLTPGATQQFTAVGKDAQDNVVPIAPTWSVVANGGTINAAGLFTAGNTAGSYANTVRATSGTISSTASVTVNPGALASITISPSPKTLATNSGQQFTAVGKDAQNNIVTFTPTWSVGAGGGTIDADGLFTAGTVAGIFTNTIRATSGTISATASVLVIPGILASITITPNPITLAQGATQQFTAVGRDANNNVVPFTPTWSLSEGGGTITESGLFTAGTVAGTFTGTVRATGAAIFIDALGTISGSATVIVSAGSLASITVSPDLASVPTGGTRTFTAVGKDANNNTVALTPTWSVVAGGGSIDAVGLFTAGKTAGHFANTVRAASGAISGTATVNINAGNLATITITPNPATLVPGATQQFSAVGRDADGNEVAINPTWSVEGGGGTISNTGLFTAGTTAGTYANVVRATRGSAIGTATVTINPGALASITLTPSVSPAALAPGATQQFTAVGKDANNNVIAITPTWSVIADGGTITTGGLFTAGTIAGSYSNTVQAASGSISGTASVTVAPAALASITITPSPVTLAPGAMQQFTAVGKDAYNNVVSVIPTWSLVEGGGTISETGLFTAGTVARTFTNTIKAASGSIFSRATVTITPGPLASITVTPSPATLIPGATQQFTAVGKDANNNIVAITPTWTVVAGGGTIGDNGLFTAGNTAGSFANTVRASSGEISGTVSVSVNPGALATITVAPSLAALAAGDTQQFTAIGKDAHDNTVSITPAWSVTAGGGTIDAAGLFTAGNTAGKYENSIQATSGTVSGSASVAITAGTLTSITITPSSPRLTPGETQQFTAVGRDAHENIVSVTPTWTVVAGGGTIDAAGLFTTGNIAGSFENTVRAVSGAVSASASIIVSPGAIASITITPNLATLALGATQQFTAVAKDAQNNVVTFTPTWRVVTGGGAINTSGLFTADTTAGSFENTIEATNGTIVGTGSVIVTPGALRTIAVTPSFANVAPGATQQFTAVGRDSYNNAIATTPTWSVVASGGTIDANGLFTAGNIPGSYENTVRASFDKISGSATVRVTAGDLASITITPNTATLSGGGTQQFTAVGRDAHDNVVPITPAWSVVANGGTIDGDGLFTAGTTAGSFENTVQATSGDISSRASVIVRAGQAVGLAFISQPTSTPVGTLFSPRIAVALVDAGGNVVTSNSSDYVTLEITPRTGTQGANLSFAGAQFQLRNGVANLNPPWIDAVGTNYTLTARTNLEFSRESNPFDITESQVASIVAVSGAQLVRSPGHSGEITVEARKSNGEPVGADQIVDLYFVGEGFACGGVFGTIATGADGRLSYTATLDNGTGVCEFEFRAPGAINIGNARIAVIGNGATHVWMAGLNGDQPGFDIAANWIKVATGTNDVPSASTDTPFFPTWSTRMGAVAQSNKTLGGLILDYSNSLDLSGYTFTTNGDISMGEGSYVQGDGQLVANGHDVNIQGSLTNITLGSKSSCSGPYADRAILSNFAVSGTLYVTCGAHVANGYAASAKGVAGSYIKILSSEATMSVPGEFVFSGDSLVLENTASLFAGSATIGGRLSMGAESSLRVSGSTLFNGTGSNLAGSISTGSVTFGGPGSAGYTFTGGTLNVFGTFSQIAGGAEAAFVADANHHTEIAAEGSSSISMSNPGPSTFGNLRLWQSTSLETDLTFPTVAPHAYLELAGGTLSVGTGRRVSLPGELMLSGGQLLMNGTMDIGGCSYVAGFTVGTTISGRGTINDTPADSFRACGDNSVSDRLPSSANRMMRVRPVAPKRPSMDARRVRGGSAAVTPSKVVKTKVKLVNTPERPR